MDETAEVQALLMHGRIAKPQDVRSAAAVVAQYLLLEVDAAADVTSAHSEEAMRAQAAAEALGPPADG